MQVVVTVSGFDIKVCPDCTTQIQMDGGVKNVDTFPRNFRHEFDICVATVQMLFACSQFLLAMGPKDK